MLSANFVIILGIGKNYNNFCGSVVLISVVLALLRKAWQWGKSFRLDELPEFSRSVLEVMRQPLEDQGISRRFDNFSLSCGRKLKILGILF